MYPIIYLIFIFLFYFIINYHLGKYEKFINFYQYINNNLDSKMKENKKDFTIHRNFKSFSEVYLKNIYLTYNEKSKFYNFYLFNYEHKLFMKINVNKNKHTFDIFDDNNKKLGNLIKKFHNKYFINLEKLYKYNYTFSINNSYREIKIFNQFESNIFYLKKNKDELKKFKIYLYEEEIGYINNDKKNYKIFIKSGYLEKINLFAYALIILIINNEN